ncbi:calcium-binding and coiled-coil domain-containing protein 2 [Stegastes partitus]|uniref:Calcium binding and coiled-coil domain 2 n=1 Tax=Stegastes partitus TaxID=144197 RepID=A0A3B4Z6X0_9TELE|nr:PREDICTED: calcium-binding and coiled-coil domain-containing protein 2 [Stegastes partitus]XP_008275989.1 PREDICTED: calcium-binding and coiled-coil domain-containing protein 2 [Stegastes partitus]
MESPPEAAAAADSSARSFSQVLFTDIPPSYLPSAPITCCYTLTTAFKPSPRDWVGIFKVGWSSTKDYHTFVWVETSADAEQQSLTRQVLFKEYYLPKDEVEFYQFCYVDGGGQVRGASTPFCFRNPAEQSMESSPDDDLLVITTQEQVEQSVREKAELQKELDLIKAQHETLKSALQKEQQEATNLKEQNDQREKEKADLLKELDQIKEQNINLRSTLELQQEENKHLKEEMVIQLANQMQMQQQSVTEQTTQSMNSGSASRTNEDKYDRAVMKINQLKEERKELKEKIEVQSEEISKLSAKLREEERDLFKTKDSNQLLQVDLQSSEKEKDKLAAELQRFQSLTQNMDEVKRENQELCRRLSQQDSLQNSPDDELKVRCQTLVRQLQDAQGKLEAEKEESKNNNRRAEFLEKELQEVKEQLNNLIPAVEQEQRKRGKLELQLNEMAEVMTDKDIVIEEKEQGISLVKMEKEELERENQKLRDDINGLRRAYTDLHAPSGDSTYMRPHSTLPAGDASAARDQQEMPQQTEQLYEQMVPQQQQEEEEEEPALVCRHCQESFPGITQGELEQHEQSHRVCPFCTMICDTMEQSVFEDHVYGHEL